MPVIRNVAEHMQANESVPDGLAVSEVQFKELADPQFALYQHDGIRSFVSGRPVAKSRATTHRPTSLLQSCSSCRCRELGSLGSFVPITGGG
jgi:hypothetical protein